MSTYMYIYIIQGQNESYSLLCVNAEQNFLMKTIIVQKLQNDCHYLFVALPLKMLVAQVYLLDRASVWRELKD